jgi:aspartyl-tRNA(Asn)/glutamyl-tRNA(Gln) amidotransferase subunit C
MISVKPTKAKNNRHFKPFMALLGPMVEVNEALIRKVAGLARLSLEESEIADHVFSIGEILKHVEQLASVNTDGVEPMIYGVDDSLRLREDEVKDFGKTESGAPRVTECAPEVEHDGFKVPRIIG